MKPRARNFIKVGNVRLRWYRRGDGRTIIDPRRYGRRPVSFLDHQEALLEGHRIAAELDSGAVGVLALSPADRAAWARLNEITRARGADPLDAIAEWNELRELVPVSSHLGWRDIMRAGLAASARQIHRTIDVVGELLNSKAAQDLDGRYAGDLRTQLRDFAAAFPSDISSITPREIDAWLTARLRRDGAPLSAKRRNHVLANISQLFKFARARGYLPDKITAAQQVEKIRICSKGVQIFTPAEMQTLVAHVEEQWLPWLLIAGWSGVRVEEIALSYHAADRKDALRWEDFDWQAREICIRSEVAKTGRPRRCPIADNLFAWLSPWKKSAARGPVVKGSLDKFRKRFRGKLARLAAESDAIGPRLLQWPHNALRHSYGSYEMARIGDMQRLSYWMGDSVAMIQRHYHNPRPLSEATAWFSIFPSAAENVIQLTLRGLV